jgi:hypothetical protein
MMQNITYLFGAGASFHSCPIWKEQAEKMTSISSAIDSIDIESKKYEELNNKEKIIWLISYFGKKANEFNTIDTYARKLYLLNRTAELNRLKAAVSCFFTIWSNYRNNQWTKRQKGLLGVEFELIDPRYINLLATYLEKGDDYPVLKENVHFVTWNYDLQLESAYLKFADLEPDDFDKINDNFPFIHREGVQKELDVCHLNGFYGFFDREPKPNIKFYDGELTDIENLLGELEFVIKILDGDEEIVKNHINYAWEKDSDLANFSRKHAQHIFSKTEILVVVGYSFPPFNHEIDKELFSKLKRSGKLKRVIIQDPNADESFISETFGIPKDKIQVVSESLDQFVIPHYHETKKKGMTVIN